MGMNKLKFCKEKGVFFVTDSNGEVLAEQGDLILHDKINDVDKCKIEEGKKYIKQVTVTFNVILDLDDLYLNND